MRRSRSFRLTAPMELEGRVVPSAMPAPVIKTLVAFVAYERAHGVNLSPEQVAQSNASDARFGLSPSDTLRGPARRRTGDDDLPPRHGSHPRHSPDRDNPQGPQFVQQQRNDL